MEVDNNLEHNWSSSSEEVLRRCYPLHRACRDGDVQHLSSLLASDEHDLYQEDDFYGWTPIHWAAYFGKLSCLLVLHKHNVCIDATTERLNQSPAHIVAYGGHANCLNWLLQHGSQINRQLACLRQLINIIESSGANGCDLVSSRFSQTPSHLCAYAGHPQCLYWLVQSQCNLNKQDYMGETPIHKAARTGSMECISLLVSQGASLSIKNYSGQNAGEVARQANHPECANYLDRALVLQENAKDQSRGSPEGQPSAQNHFISNNTYHSNPHVNSHPAAHGAAILNGCHDNNNQSEDCSMEMDDGIDAGSQVTSSRDVLMDHGVTTNLVPVAGKKRGREEIQVDCNKRARNDDFVFMNGKNGESHQIVNGIHHHGNTFHHHDNTVHHHDNTASDPLTRNSELNGWTQKNHCMPHQLSNQGSLSSHMTNLTNRVQPVSTNCGLASYHMTNLHNERTNQVLPTGHLSESMVEHSATLCMQQGYDSLMLESLIAECHGS